MTFHLSIYGTGGSLPVSSPERQEFGGATSCYLVERGEQRLILDGGSGLVPLGQTLKQLPQEKIEYLLTRLPKTEARKEFETHALEHVMSFQRRVAACMREFLARQKKTPPASLKTTGTGSRETVVE